MLTETDHVATTQPPGTTQQRATLHLNGGAQDLAHRVRSRFRSPKPTARISSRSGSQARNPSTP